MTSDFQLSLLSFFVQFPEGSQYISDVDETVFDLLEDKLTIQVLKKYYNIYKVLPSKTNVLEFLEEQIKQTPNLSKDVEKGLRANFEDIYVPLPLQDKQQLQDAIIINIQNKSLENIFMDFAAGKVGATQLFTKVNKLSSLVKSGTSGYDDGGFLVQDRYKHFDEQVEGNPTFLHDLNMMTAAHGFYSPQLIIFLSGPKHFKTGVILKLGIEYARCGNKVYWADNENGARSIRNRAKMSIMECELPDLYDSTMREELDDTLYRFGHYMKGDLFIDSYAAYSKTVSDVRSRLEYLREKHNWKPDIIIYDTIDKFAPSNPLDQKRDTRIRIQLVYDEVINLNKELGTFAIAPSQVNRAAINKKVFDIKDLSEDFGKAMNAHAIFAICADPEEMELGIRRIVPVAQREGTRYKANTACYVQVDEKIMSVAEIDKEKTLEKVNDD